MSNKKKSSKIKEDAKRQKNLNADNLESLKRLLDAIASLDDNNIGGTSINNNVTSNDDLVAIRINHWREMTDEINHAYKMLHDGAALIKATSTKYTLVGKINVDDGSKFSNELRQGCELISTAALLVHEPDLGCSRSLRKQIKHHSRATVGTVISLIESFQTLKAMDKNVGAQKTGAVWSKCDDILTKLPKGNRAAMRREIFTWVGECNETMQEFQEIVNLGPSKDENDSSTGEDESSSWDAFGEDQYTDKEIDIVAACIAIMKCSRGVLGLTMKACECAGELAERTRIEEEGRSKAIFQWISNAHELTSVVGKNVTELGVCLYAPIKLEILDEECEKDSEESTHFSTELEQQIILQTKVVIEAANYIRDHTLPETIDNDSLNMTEEIMELANKLIAAVNTRKDEADTAIFIARNGNNKN